MNFNSYKLDVENLYMENNYIEIDSWLDENKIKTSIIPAIANASIIMAKNNDKNKKLFPYEYNIANYILIMKEISKFVQPKLDGVYTLKGIIKSFKAYGKSKDIEIQEILAPWRWDLENISQYIKSALIYGSPVFLITWNTKIKSLEKRWVLITGIEIVDDEINIIIVNKGKKEIHKLENWIKNFSFYRGVIYFT